MAGFVDWLGNKFGVVGNPVVVTGTITPTAPGPAPSALVNPVITAPVNVTNVAGRLAVAANIYIIRQLAFAPNATTMYIGYDNTVTTLTGFPLVPGMAGFDFSRWPATAELWAILSTAGPVPVTVLQY